MLTTQTVASSPTWSDRATSASLTRMCSLTSPHTRFVALMTMLDTECVLLLVPILDTECVLLLVLTLGVWRS